MKTVSDFIREEDDDGLMAAFHEAMHTQDISRMATMAHEYIQAYIDFDSEIDLDCLHNAEALLKEIDVRAQEQEKQLDRLNTSLDEWIAFAATYDEP